MLIIYQLQLTITKIRETSFVSQLFCLLFTVISLKPLPWKRENVGNCLNTGNAGFTAMRKGMKYARNLSGQRPRADMPNSLLQLDMPPQRML